MLTPEVTTPSELPVTLAYIKAQSVVDFDCDDALLAEDIASAAGYLDGPEGILGRALLDQTVVQRLSGFSCPRLLYGPATSVTSVEYYDVDGVLQTLSGALYSLLSDDDGSYINFIDQQDVPFVYDRPDAVIITYQAGWSSPAAVPRAIKKAIAMIVSEWYENRTGTNEGRTSIKEIPHGANVLIEPYRKVGV